jgi:hypothetical protein
MMLARFQIRAVNARSSTEKSLLKHPSFSPTAADTTLFLTFPLSFPLGRSLFAVDVRAILERDANFFLEAYSNAFFISLISLVIY